MSSSQLNARLRRRANKPSVYARVRKRHATRADAAEALALLFAQSSQTPRFAVSAYTPRDKKKRKTAKAPIDPECTPPPQETLTTTGAMAADFQEELKDWVMVDLK